MANKRNYTRLCNSRKVMKKIHGFLTISSEMIKCCFTSNTIKSNNSQKLAKNQVAAKQHPETDSLQLKKYWFSLSTLPNKNSRIYCKNYAKNLFRWDYMTDYRENENENDRWHKCDINRDESLPLFSSVGVFHIFQIIQIVPNRAKHLILTLVSTFGLCLYTYQKSLIAFRMNVCTDYVKTYFGWSPRLYFRVTFILTFPSGVIFHDDECWFQHFQLTNCCRWRNICK